MSDGSLEVEIALVVATAILALTTWNGTRNSNNLLKEELKTRYRPSLARIHMQFPSEDIEQMRIHSKALFRIKNVGSLPATNVRIEYYVKIVENGEESNMQSSEECFPGGKIESSLAPQESYGVDIPMDQIHLESMFNSNTCYFGLIIWYTSPSNKLEYQYKMEGHFDHGEIMLHNTTQMT